MTDVGLVLLSEDHSGPSSNSMCGSWLNCIPKPPLHTGRCTLQRTSTTTRSCLVMAISLSTTSSSKMAISMLSSIGNMPGGTLNIGTTARPFLSLLQPKRAISSARIFMKGSITPNTFWTRGSACRLWMGDFSELIQFSWEHPHSRARLVPPRRRLL